MKNNKKIIESYLVVEGAGILRAGNYYSVLDNSGNVLMLVVEEIPKFFKKMLKFTPLKTLLAFNIVFYDKDNKVVFTLKRSFTFFLSKINIYDDKNNLIGIFDQKLRLWKSCFSINNEKNEPLAFIKGDWRDWKFRIVDTKKELIGGINKKWAGFIKEIFTTADKYVVNIFEEIDENKKLFFIAGAVIIDLILKEYT